MEYFVAYHAESCSRAQGICDAPHISKGRMTISGEETSSAARHMALIQGRLRNRSELANELGCAPYVQAAELLLAAYLRWDEAFIEHIHGPCLCCIADVEKDKLLVARDRMGEVSAFYAQRYGGIVVAAHPDMLLRSAFVEPVLDREGLCELMGLGPARTPGRTPIAGLKSIEPGCMLICEGDALQIRRYFELDATPCGDDEELAVERVRELLERSVNDIVGLHPACMLSGGLDSTALTALLSARIGRLDTFSVDYRNNAQDFVPNSFRPEMDAPYVRLAARVFGTRHHNVVLEQDALVGALGLAVRRRGFPGMADIDTSLLLFAKNIARIVPNVVSGECGDEVFGGYPWFRGDVSMPEDAFPWSGSIELRESILRPELREKLNLRGYVRDALHHSLDAYDVSAVDGAQERALFKLQRLCFDYFMANLQERATAMCAEYGLQVLTPLCDDRLVSYVYRLPWRIKRMGGMEKGLFREAMRDYLPDKLRLRKKSPYPKTCSAEYTLAVRSEMRKLCGSADAPIWKIIDVDRIEQLAASALDPADTPWYGQLMAGPQMLAYLLQLNHWMRERDIRVEL